MNIREACERHGISIDSIQCTPEILDIIEKKANERKLMFEYFEIENTINERNSMVTARFEKFDQAKEDLKNRSDWYCDKGTGRIYHVVGTVNKTTGAIDIKREQVWKNP